MDEIFWLTMGFAALMLFLADRVTWGEVLAVVMAAAVFYLLGRGALDVLHSVFG